ncbi:MAG: DegV family protein [Clostridia bacterium]|nr:DegV family protein [Clostridia bacterium]
MICIVTDSTAYLTHDEAAELGVVIVPMSYSFGDGHSINEGCIEEDMHAEREVAARIDIVHTSQATLSAFINTFSMLRRSGYEILCLTMSSRLSGTYANAVLAARELGGKHIEVVDSLSTCSGLYLLVREARMRIREGDKLSAVAKYLNKLRHRVRLYFSVDDMAPLRRSGRLGNVRMSISTVLNIKPMLEVRDGAVVSAGLARGRVDQANKLCAFCKNARGRLIIDNFLGEEAATQLPVRLAREDREIERRRTGPVLGAHLGAGCVGVAYIEDMEKK